MDDPNPQAAIETQPQSAPQLGYDPEVSRRHGAFYAEKPEALRVALDEYEKRTGERFIPRTQYDADMKARDDRAAALEQKFAASEHEKLLTKALLAHGLNESHARFIHGETAEELDEAAAEFAALLPKDETDKPKPAPAPKPKPKAQEPGYQERDPAPVKPESVADIMAEIRAKELAKPQ